METWFCLFDDEYICFEFSYVKANSEQEAVTKFKKHIGRSELPQRCLFVTRTSEIPLIE